MIVPAIVVSPPRKEEKKTQLLLQDFGPIRLGKQFCWCRSQVPSRELRLVAAGARLAPGLSLAAFHDLETVWVCPGCV